MVRQLKTLAEFNEVLKSTDKLIVVDFTATWCGPCQHIGPIFVKLSEELTDVVFVKVDVDENDETAKHCNISAMPTLHFYKDTKLVHDFCGASDVKLKQAIVQYK
uniref:Thioredoxin n=1 Tax=Dugesia japonica TaxID=6161 RepID=A0A068AX24_DUGJA|nr:thioredoxin [Dugesia japonica]